MAADEAEYRDQGEAELAWGGFLRCWAEDGGQPDSLFRGSKLMRPKWDERRGHETYGAHTIRKALETTSTHTYGQAKPPSVAEDLLTICLADVEHEPVEWLWPGYILYRKLAILDGDPGMGKSTLSLDIAARVSAGAPMPDGSMCRPGGVLLLTAEDGLGDTVRPRLEAAGADLTRVVANCADKLPSLP